MSHNKALDSLSREQLIELLEIYSKNWLAADMVEYGEFARAIDSRFTCECISCYPEITDETCCCSWKFTLHEEAV